MGSVPDGIWIARRQDFFLGRQRPHRRTPGTNPRSVRFRTISMKIVAPLLTTCVLALAACGGTESSAPPRTNAVVSTGGGASTDATIEVTTIEIMNSRFSAPELRVSAGTTVRFVNRDEYAHTVTSAADSPMSFDSAGLALADTFEVTFDTAGEFAYFCQIHPTMRGVVIVE